MVKSSKDLQLLDETSTKIFQRNLIDRYAERPYQPNSINNLCFAQFAAYYYKSVKYSSENAKSMNDDQPEILTDTVMEKQSADENHMPDNNNKKRSHTQLDSRKQVIAFQDRVMTINIKEAQHPLK